jgi:hypothetical protein
LIGWRSFILEKTHWSYAFRLWRLQTPQRDFDLIAETMREKTPANTLSVAGA